MKFRLINLVIVLFCVQKIWSDPLLVTVLMVKNEASVIEETLRPFVEGGIKDFVIFDTGSTDGTQEIATNFFKQHNIINAHIIQEPFIDFSTSRNHALEAAESLFAQATFILMPDAEWYMHNVEGLLKFCAEHYHDSANTSYLVPIRSDALAFFTCRLIRCHKNVRFVGPVHEVLNHISQVMLPDDIYFEWRPAQTGIKKTAQRWLRDRDILLKSYAENPYDPRTLFYLAQTYDCLGDLENAQLWYEKRIAMGGWDEEVFMAHYRISQVYERMGNWPQALYHYITAYAQRPHRAEPLIHLAQHYLSFDKKDLSMLFAQAAVNIPYPHHERLFVDRQLYTTTRYELLEKISTMNNETKEIFTNIYKNNSWGDPESRSGSGSSLLQTKTIRKKLPRLLQQLNIKSILDVPCGDCNWISQTNLDQLQYYGADIVEDIIINNRNKSFNFASSVIFIQKDIISDLIPRVDLILCRDCFPHLTYEQIKEAIKNFKNSGSKYLLTTTYEKNETNFPIHTGYWMPLNLEKPPFNFPKPLMIIDEKATDWCNAQFGKSLGLWLLEDIKI